MALAAETPTRSAPIRPGVDVTAMRLMSVSVTDAADRASRDDGHEVLQVLPRRKLRDHAAVLFVQFDLRRYDVRKNGRVPEHRRSGLIAGSFYAEGEHDV